MSSRIVGCVGVRRSGNVLQIAELVQGVLKSDKWLLLCYTTEELRRIVHTYLCYLSSIWLHLYIDVYLAISRRIAFWL